MTVFQKKAIFIVGPTAAGKTSLAVILSKKFPSILISADSVQVYKGVDIISGKDHPKDSRIFLIDAISPFENFSVHEYVEKVRPIVQKAFDEHKTSIIVGGAGFYADALISPFETISVPSDETLRKKLEKLTMDQLQKKLNDLDPIRFQKMNNSDVNNKRRLTRAIEVTQAQDPTLKLRTGSRSAERAGPLFREDEVLMIGLKTSMQNLRERIKARVEQRLRTGALDEAKKLFENYAKLSPQIKTASGYKQLFGYLLGDSSFEEAVSRWIIVEGQNAKNQMTWFKRNKNIIWFDIEEKGFEEGIFELTCEVTADL